MCWIRTRFDLTQIQVTKFQNGAFFKVKKKPRVLKGAPNFFLRELKHNETKVAEEYCWAITQSAARSWCGRSGSSVLDFGFQLNCLVYYTYTVC
jgi:hypothetical protein